MNSLQHILEHQTLNKIVPKTQNSSSQLLMPTWLFSSYNEMLSFATFLFIGFPEYFFCKVQICVDVFYYLLKMPKSFSFS